MFCIENIEPIKIKEFEINYKFLGLHNFVLSPFSIELTLNKIFLFKTKKAVDKDSPCL